MALLTSVRALRPYVLEVTFDDGAVRAIDIEPQLYGPMFEPLKDFRYFARVRIDEDRRSVSWPNGADLAPEFLYSRAPANTSR